MGSLWVPLHLPHLLNTTHVLLCPAGFQDPSDSLHQYNNNDSSSDPDSWSARKLPPGEHLLFVVTSPEASSTAQGLQASAATPATLTCVLSSAPEAEAARRARLEAGALLLRLYLEVRSGADCMDLHSTCGRFHRQSSQCDVLIVAAYRCIA